MRGRVVALVFGTALGGCAPAATMDDTAVRTEISDFLAEYNAAFGAVDTARIRALYTPDDRLVWLEDGVVKYRSVAEILASLASLPPGLKSDTRLTNTDIQLLGPDVATVSAEFQTEFRSEAGEGFGFGGALSMVVERHDAVWKVVSGHTSTPREAWQPQ